MKTTLLSVLSTLLICVGWLLAGGVSLAGDSAPAGVGERLVLTDGSTLLGQSRTLRDGYLEWLTTGGEVRWVSLGDIERLEFDPTEPVADLALDDPAAEELPLLPAPELLDPDLVEELDWADREVQRHLAPGPWSLPPITQYWEAACNRMAETTNRIAAGGRYQQGNSDELFIDIAGEFERRVGRRFSQTTIGGQYGQQNGVRATNRWFANSTLDYELDGKWILFAQMRDEFDEFKHLDYRISGFAGPGYRFFDEAKRRLIVRVGAGVTHEIFDDPDLSRTTPDLFGELETRWPLWERVQFEQKTTVHPSIEDFSLVRLLHNSGVLFALDRDARWNVKLGYQYQLNSQPNVGRTAADTMMTMSVVYTRKR